MRSTLKTRIANRRKAAALALALLGVAGVAIGSAATLSLTGETGAKLVQAGVDDLSGELCQSSTIAVTFTLDGSTPGALVTGSSFGYPSAVDAIVLDEIDAACAGNTIKVALGSSANAIVGTEYTGTATAGPLTLALDGPGPDFGTALTNAQIASIAQVSVTIYG